VKKQIFASVIIFLIIITSDNLYPNSTYRKRFDISAGLERYSGFTQYTIGGRVELPDGTVGYVQFPLSELKFQLDVFMLFLDFKAAIFDKLLISINGKTNINRDSGTMEDSDWGVWYQEGYPWASPTTLDIYSESDAELRAYILNSKLLYRVLQSSQFTFGVGLGFLFQRFDFEIHNTTQWYPSYEVYSSYLPIDYSYTYYMPGRVLTYVVDYYIPYFELALVYMIKGNIGILGSIEISPYTWAEDLDDHILRSKKGRGESEGTYASCSLGGRYVFTQDLYLEIGIHYRVIMTEGEQVQTRYANTPEGPPGRIATIQNKLKSDQFSFYLAVGFLFDSIL
jgi:outer membrane protease